MAKYIKAHTLYMSGSFYHSSTTFIKPKLVFAISVAILVEIETKQISLVAENILKPK